MTAKLLRQFEQYRLKHGRYCYYDTPVLAAALLKDAAIAKQVSKDYPVIVIDELQDVSKDQFSIALRIANAGSRLIAVGDSRQFINSFMGADNDLFHRMKLKAKLKVVTVQINRSLRLTESVARAVRGIENQMSVSGLKKLVGGNNDDPQIKPLLIRCPSSTRMAEHAAWRIARDIEAGVLPHEILVNYRFTKGNMALRLLKRELRRRGIEYIQTPMRASWRRQMSKFIAVLKAVAAPDDELLLASALQSNRCVMRVLTVAARRPVSEANARIRVV